jgi:Protein of unknown function (DUF3305)
MTTDALGPTMGRVVNIMLGVVAAREAVVSPWQDHIWRAVSVFLDPPPLSDGWRELRRGETFVHSHIANLELELHRKETPGYIANLLSGTPSVYVVLREGAANGGPEPIHAHLLTASAHDVEAYGHTPADIIGQVAMPEPLLELLEAFIATHHVDEKFVKRRRQEHHVEEEHKFGQEPVHEVRERMRAWQQDKRKPKA